MVGSRNKVSEALKPNRKALGMPTKRDLAKADRSMLDQTTMGRLQRVVTNLDKRGKSLFQT